MTIDLTELRKLAEAATQGPWEDDGGGEIAQHWSRPEPWVQIVSTDVTCMAYCYGGSAQGVAEAADAEFIAAANPATVLALIDRLEKAEAAIARVATIRALRGEDQ